MVMLEAYEYFYLDEGSIFNTCASHLSNPSICINFMSWVGRKWLWSGVNLFSVKSISLFFPLTGCFHLPHPVDFTVNLLYSLPLMTYILPYPQKENVFLKPAFTLPVSKQWMNRILSYFGNVFVPIFIVHSFIFVHWLTHSSIIQQQGCTHPAGCHG